MSPKFYGLLWVIFFAVAGILWIGNVFTMLTTVVFGFIAFGLVFAGMICVLPGTVSQAPMAKLRTPKVTDDPSMRSANAGSDRTHLRLNLRVH